MKTTAMNVICSMCNQLLKTKNGEGISGDSHSLCSNCLEEVLDSIKESRRRFILNSENASQKRFYPYIKENL